MIALKNVPQETRQIYIFLLNLIKTQTLISKTKIEMKKIIENIKVHNFFYILQCQYSDNSNNPTCKT